MWEGGGRVCIALEECQDQVTPSKPIRADTHQVSRRGRREVCSPPWCAPTVSASLLGTPPIWYCKSQVTSCLFITRHLYTKPCIVSMYFIRPSDEPHPEVKPDGYVDNLAQAVELFLKYRS